MEIFAQTVVNGLLLSSIYILVAVGFALIFSLMQVLNFAHGVIYMVGAYVCYYWGAYFGLGPWGALLMSALTVGLFGLFLEKFCFRPFHGDFNRTLMVSLALIIILQAAADVTVGGYVKRVPTVLPGVMNIWGLTLSNERVVTFIIALFLLSGLTLLIQKTKLGQQMRALAQDRDAAALQGINVHFVSGVAFGLACALAALAGGLMASIISMNVHMGDAMLVKAIALVIVAGMGSIGGLFISGLIIGFMDATLPLFIGGAGSDVVAFCLVIIILLIRPQGLFGIEV